MSSSLDPNALAGPRELEAFLREEFPQALPVGFQVLEADREQVTLRLEIGERHLRPGGTVSGPVLMMLADTGVYLALLVRIGRVPLAVTSDLHIRFLRRPRPTVILAKARLLKLGRTLAVGEVRLYIEGDDELVAVASATYVIPPPAPEPEPGPSSVA